MASINRALRREAKQTSKKNRMPKHGKTSLATIGKLDRVPKGVIDRATGKKNKKMCPKCGGPKNKKALFCKDCQNGNTPQKETNFE